MCVRHLAFVLLIWFPAVLHAQKAEQPCPAPQLDHGYLVLEKENQLTYACDEGYKPTAEGWWATSTCENGQWSPKPQCIGKCLLFPPTVVSSLMTKNVITGVFRAKNLPPIGWQQMLTIAHIVVGVFSYPSEEKSCLPPTIINGNYFENPNGWYAEHRTITIKCDDGYELKGQPERIRCINGTWPPLPVCESKSVRSAGLNFQQLQNVATPVSTFTVSFHSLSVLFLYTESPNACDGPPQIPHAVIIKQGYQEVFVENSKVVYECESGYTTDGIATETSVLCSSGNWTGIPSCHVYCLIDPANYNQDNYQVTKVQYLKEGEKKKIRCPYWPGAFSNFRCTNGRIAHTQCKYNREIFTF
uniref:Sushi domain-containing protein n=1 Tax=Amphiprion ocellaris TaxID=80972 RepID=A0AAQ5XEM6_AMPOC